MAARTLRLQVEKLPLHEPFRISGHIWTEVEVVVATVEEAGRRGRGEAAGVYYMNDDVHSMVAAIEAVRAEVEAGIERTGLQQLLPPGGARNALDCALWELDSVRAATPVWKLAGLAQPRPLITTFTLGAEDPEVMAARARRYHKARALKLKLTGDLELDQARVQAVRDARPEAWIGVDANQGYAGSALPALVRSLEGQRVALLEQPVPRGNEPELQGFRSRIPIAADESVLSLKELPAAVGRFDVVNIKLDKCGGLTEGLAMASEARRLGMKVMVGNMVGTSLAMAPGFVLGQLCDIVDLDGPIFLTRDRKPGVNYDNGYIWSDESVWGGAVATAA
jgi:L-alanine-DL-glutamate epimerase-like enolase superfamily enzyme